MLRIDINSQPGGQPYGIPIDNPFAANACCNVNGTGTRNCPEIYAFGLRNPWRWSFDRQTGTQWVADVGQASYEEINIVTRGGNYGWDHREGGYGQQQEDDLRALAEVIAPFYENYGLHLRDIVLMKEVQQSQGCVLRVLEERENSSTVSL